ncbi:MAG TPA: CBS domain-containing protein [Bdellovibrionota bacterium]
MKILRDVMTQNAQCLDPESSLRAVAAKMKEIDCGAVPICHNDRLVGMVTDRDMVTKALAEGRDPNSTRARDVMTSPIVYCFEDQDIGEAARVMEVRQIRRLVVLNKDKRLVGIVSLGDLSLRGGSEELPSEVLEKVSEPRHQIA